MPDPSKLRVELFVLTGDEPQRFELFEKETHILESLLALA